MQTGSKRDGSSFLQHSLTSESLPSPCKPRRLVTRMAFPSAGETGGDQVAHFRKSFIALKAETGRPEELISQMTDKGTKLGSDATKNIQRLSIFGRKSTGDESPKPLMLVKVPLLVPTTPAASKFIDDHYPNSATSRATNRLPLPADSDFSKPTKVFRGSALSITDSAEILQMYRHLDRTLTQRQPQRKSVLQDGSLQLYWSVKPAAGSRPESREGASICMLDRKVYMFGGQSMTKRNDLRALNTDAWTWTMVQAEYQPKGRIGHTLVAYKNQLILFGGWSHYSQRLRIRRCVKKVYTIYLDQEPRWQRFRGYGALPKSRRYHSASVLGSSMLVFGGIDPHSKVLKGLRVLEIDSLNWVKPRMTDGAGPGARSNSSLTAVFHYNLLMRSDFSVFAMPKPKIDQMVRNCGFYLFGGLNEKSKVMGDLWALTVLGDGFTWMGVETTGIPPLARSDHTAVLVNGYLAIFGGRNDDMYGAYGDCCIRDVSLLNIETLQWESLKCYGALPEGRWGHCAVPFGSQVLVIGGINTHSFLPSDLYALETDQPIVDELVRRDADKEALKLARMAKVRRSSILRST